MVRKKQSRLQVTALKQLTWVQVVIIPQTGEASYPVRVMPQCGGHWVASGSTLCFAVQLLQSLVNPSLALRPAIRVCSTIELSLARYVLVGDKHY